MNKEVFKFPDEKGEPKKEDAASEEIQIEVVDDTPPEDRGREPLPKELVKELEEDDLEEYSDKVKKRLSQMKKLAHDERREKERVARERDEATAFAKVKMEEARALRERLGRGEEIFSKEMSKAATNDIAAAKALLKQAYEDGDADKIADAQEALTDAKLRLREVQGMKPSVQHEEKGVEHAHEQSKASQPVVDSRAEKWREENTWFGVDPEMTSLALGLHEKLVRSNVDPTSDEYYKTINATMRKRFPEYFDEGGESTQPEEREKPAPRTKSVVASVSRSTAPNKVTLSPTAVALAKKLGITPEVYAKEVLKLGNANG
jgi:hypothetical protein